MNIRIFALLCGVVLSACQPPQPKDAPTEATEASFIPAPQEITYGSERFILDPSTTIAGEQCNPEMVKYLREQLTARGIVLSSETNATGPIIALQCGQKGVSLDAGEEAYSLVVSADSVVITAATETGVFRGMHSFLQAVDQAPEAQAKTTKRTLLAMTISDSPAFVHRGMHLDVGRHFFEVSTVKDYIDLLAYYKMNVLHWHLTEDQGWRIAIDKYPNLTEKGAWRTELDGSRYGGFYTKDQIREVVEYATSRHIRVIPEIELPGHAQAAISAYPQLSCTGEQVPVANDWGVFKEIYCAGNDSVFVFLKDVLDEVMELFPSEYIHIGGDEAPKYRWENCPKCQRRIAKEGLADEHELQSWFISQIGIYLAENGRQLIGWDEILEGGIPEGAIVQSWRGMDGGMAAVKVGHRAIMSPTSHCYFDYDVRSIDLEQVYNFNPIPDSLPEELHAQILGGQCNLWSEHIPDRATLDRQTFPRILAMTEVLWNAPENRDFPEFHKRVAEHYPILEKFGVHYGLEVHPFEAKSHLQNDSLFVVFEANRQDLELRLTDSLTDKSNYANHPEHVAKGIQKHFYVQTVRNGKDVGAPEPVFVWGHFANFKQPEIKYPYKEAYTAGGPLGLTDGFLGSLDFRDGRWQGYWGDDLNATIDLGEVKEINHLALRTFQYNNAWIFLPEEVRFFIATEPEVFTAIGTAYPTAQPERRGQFTETYSVFTDKRVKARYVKVVARNLGTVPDWHEAAGSDAWLFVDEIIVE